MYVCFNAHSGSYLYNDGQSIWTTTPSIQKATKKTNPDVFRHVIKNQFSCQKPQWKIIDMDSKQIEEMQEPHQQTQEVSYVDTLQDGELVKIVNALQDLNDVMNSSAFQKLLERESALDKRLSEIYHRIETSHANAFQAWQFYKELKEVLIQRRDIKDSISIYQRITSTNRPFYDVSLEVIKYMNTRDWSRRQFDKEDNT